MSFPKHVFKIFIYYLYIYLQLQHWLMVSLEKFMSHQCVCVILVQFYNLIRFLYNSSNNNNNIHLQHQANDNNCKHLFNQFNNNNHNNNSEFHNQVHICMHTCPIVCQCYNQSSSNKGIVCHYFYFFYYGSWPCMWFYVNLYITLIVCDNCLYMGFVAIVSSIVIKHV